MKNHLISRAMRDSDHFVISMNYTDSKGVVSRRVVSPIRFLGTNRFLALCLCREEPRQFYLDRCENIALLPSADVMMPLAIA